MQKPTTAKEWLQYSQSVRDPIPVLLHSLSNAHDCADFEVEEKALLRGELCTQYELVKEYDLCQQEYLKKETRDLLRSKHQQFV